MEAREIVVALIELGLTQTQIAEKTGIPQPTISKVARGDVDDVLSRNYRKLLTLHSEMLVQSGKAAPAQLVAAPAAPAEPAALADERGG